VDASGLTTFWVMRSKKYKDCMPAEAVISREFATQFANLIASEGDALATWLSKTGIALPTQRLDIDKFRHHFGFHCVVMQGHLPNSCWPRVKRRNLIAWPTMVCTCLEFLMRGACEHEVFVKALLDPNSAAAMQKAPQLRRKGRKRKAQDPTTEVPKKKARAKARTASA